jgi:hypothetical protein
MKKNLQTPDIDNLFKAIQSEAPSFSECQLEVQEINTEYLITLYCQPETLDLVWNDRSALVVRLFQSGIRGKLVFVVGEVQVGSVKINQDNAYALIEQASMPQVPTIRSVEEVQEMLYASSLPALMLEESLEDDAPPKIFLNGFARSLISQVDFKFWLYLSNALKRCSDAGCWKLNQEFQFNELWFRLTLEKVFTESGCYWLAHLR